MARQEIREQVIAQIAQVMAEGEAIGHDPMAYAEEKFPGTPMLVMADAWSRFDDAKEQKWWDSVEKTIDGEIIRRAIGKVGE